MDKNQTRDLKSHYGARWACLKHNRKHLDKVLMIEDRLIIGNLLPGTTLAPECLGEVYRDIFPIDTTAQHCNYSNLLLINNLEFKYRTVAQIIEMINQHASVLDLAGRLIVNINLMFLIYDRLNVTVSMVEQQFEQQLNDCGFRLHQKYSNINHWTHGFGQLFLILNRE